MRHASRSLAFCDIRTLYLRNVPDEVATRLEELAARAHMSMSAFVVRELSEVAARAQNRALLADLPDLDVEVEALLADLDVGRSGR